MSHWAIKWVGKSYPENGCWGLLTDIYLAEFNTDLPAFEDSLVSQSRSIKKIQSELASGERWELADAPFDGAGVAMTQHNLIHHVGVYADVDGGRVLHPHNGRVMGADSAWLRRWGWKVRCYRCLV